MKIILARCGNGYCGCDSEDVFFYGEDVTDDEIGEDLYGWACENAESFSYVHFGWDEEYTDEEYEDYMENNVEFDWHVATYEEYVEWCENWGITPKNMEEI